MLQDPAVTARLSDTKAAGEVKALEQFYRTLQDDPAKAYYGYKHVQRANEAQAVETLLCSDKLFRSVLSSRVSNGCQSAALLHSAAFVIVEPRNSFAC